MIRDNRVFPDWPAPGRVNAFTTTRQGGVSEGPFDSWNLGAHVGDDVGHVAANRAILGFSDPVQWLNQVHGIRVVELPHADANVDADACFTRAPNVTCGVLTADCLPVFFTDKSASVVGVAHAGWRGIAAGVIEATIDAMKVPATELLAYLGPAIGQNNFQVDDDMREIFVGKHPDVAAAFKADVAGKWRADIYHLARHRLAKAGVDAIYGGKYCTYSQSDLFFSFRRTARTGRMASVIWLTPAV